MARKKWTKESVKKEARKYESKSVFIKMSRGAANAARRMGIWEEVCSHMKVYIPSNKWTKGRCKSMAIKCKTRGEFQDKHVGAYQAAHRNGWLDELCVHMVSYKKPCGYWTKERCMLEAKKYKTRNSFQKYSSGAYNAAWGKKWLDEICSHMELAYVPRDYWTKEICFNEAKKFNSRKEFRFYSLNAYLASRRNGWLDEICAHYDENVKQWTREMCLKEAGKYASRDDFYRDSPNAYCECVKNGWNDILIDLLNKERGLL